MAWVAHDVLNKKAVLIRFTLYSRSYCHLCEEMLSDLRSLLGSEKSMVSVVDVDDDPSLVALYDEVVPVLIGHHADGSDIRLCHYHLDSIQVRAFFSSQALLQHVTATS